MNPTSGAPHARCGLRSVLPRPYRCPRLQMSPRPGVSSSPCDISSVDLPAPTGHTAATTAPGRTARSIPAQQVDFVRLAVDCRICQSRESAKKDIHSAAPPTGFHVARHGAQEMMVTTKDKPPERQADGRHHVARTEAWAGRNRCRGLTGPMRCRRKDSSPAAISDRRKSANRQPRITPIAVPMMPVKPRR